MCVFVFLCRLRLMSLCETCMSSSQLVFEYQSNGYHSQLDWHSFVNNPCDEGPRNQNTKNKEKYHADFHTEGAIPALFPEVALVAVHV